MFVGLVWSKSPPVHHIPLGMAATATLFMVVLMGSLLYAQGSGCAEYGGCGLNGFCLVVDNYSNCSCPPGFDFVVRNNPSKGCFQIPSQQTSKCSAIGGEMVNKGHIDWSGNDYEFTTGVSEAACQQACVQDCFCTVVIHANLDGLGYCWKKALPLRDGRASSTRTAFVKVSKTTTCT
ncbi:hypothetical protein SUGI_0104490 [Cryptomeria japonica]|nr:hypothetical protein SUGI_0104490 [Cryptomeria japonica]